MSLHILLLDDSASQTNAHYSHRAAVHVILRPTEQEAKDYYAYYVDQNADWEGADRLMTGLIAHSKTFASEVQDKLRRSMAAGHASWLVIGDPRQVADKLISLREVGFVGTAISFVDYIKEFPYFRDEVMPLLEQAGIRKPVGTY